MKQHLHVSGVVPLVLASAAFFVLGDLTPPPGAVAPSGKVLTDLEPRIAINATNTPGDANSVFRITQRGSYYLTGNVLGAVAKHGIEIEASNVTLDLNGFCLFGLPGTLDGVASTGTLFNVTVKNGGIEGWGDDGIDLFATKGAEVSNVRAKSNSGDGIYVFDSAVIRDCSSVSNVGYGFFAQDNCTFSNCSANENLGDGFFAFDSHSISGCAASYNIGSGFTVQGGCSFSDCVTTGNSGHGFATGAGCTLTGTNAFFNQLLGFTLGSNNVATDCAVSNNQSGGIAANSGCAISRCSVNSNAGVGITGSTGTIEGCVVSGNGGDGIRVGFRSFVLRNNCNSNGSGLSDGASIHATGNDNRIEGNTCSISDRGIDVDTTGSIVIRNTCSGNTTNWDIVAGNSVAPIISTSTNAAAILGSTYAGSLGSTDPNANFTY